MALRLDLDHDAAEDALQAEIAALDDTVRAHGRIGDLVRLRDARIRAGLAQAHVAPPSVLQRPVVTAPAGVEGVQLPDMDLSQLDAAELRIALDHHGVAILRNAMPLRETLRLRGLFDAALSAGDELRRLEDDDMPDIRHTDSKEMFQPISEKIGLPDDVARAFLGDKALLSTFMSPRITFDWLDILTSRGFRSLFQTLLQDTVRLSLDRCLIRHMRADDPSPDWSHRAGPAGHGLMLWVPLSDCGGGTDRPGLDVELRATARLAEQDQAQMGPFIAAGDAMLIKNPDLISKPCDGNFTQDTIAIETCFLPQSRAARKDFPVFW